MARKPKFEQFIPDGPEPMFQEVVETPGANYWHAKITDAIQNDRPEFRYYPPKKGCPFTVQELANRVAGELNEARGVVRLQEFINGIPTFTAIFVSNTQQVVCVHSSDEDRCKRVKLNGIIRWLDQARVKGLVAVNGVRV